MHSLLEILCLTTFKAPLPPKVSDMWSCCCFVRLMICSDAGAIGFVVSSIMHGCYSITPHNIKKKLKPIDWPSEHRFCGVLPPLTCFFLFWRQPLQCKKLCTEMCVTVYYLNVSGLQSDRHSNNKENMFWTSCFCPWICVSSYNEYS